MTEAKPNSSSSQPASLLNRCDALGSILSSLCAVHCVCMPVLVGVLPVLGLTFLANHAFERTISIGMILFAATCVWSGCRIHRRWGLLGLLTVGAALVLYVQLAEGANEEAEAAWTESVMMVVGGVLIAVSHVLNRRLRAKCHCGQCEATREASRANGQAG